MSKFRTNDCSPLLHQAILLAFPKQRPRRLWTICPDSLRCRAKRTLQRGHGTQSPALVGSQADGRPPGTDGEIGEHVGRTLNLQPKCSRPMYLF